MNKLLAAGVIALLAITTIALIGYGYLQQHEANQLKTEPHSSPTHTSSETPVELSSVPKPSAPEFTVKLVAYPYDVPPTTTTEIDEYTGKEIVTTTPGYHVENKSIEITIENQHLTDEDGHVIYLCYTVRVKGHFGNNWKELYSTQGHSTYPYQSHSEYTVLSCSADYPHDSRIDFQVEAMVCHLYNELAGRPIQPLYVLAVDSASGWSIPKQYIFNKITLP